MTQSGKSKAQLVESIHRTYGLGSEESRRAFGSGAESRKVRPLYESTLLHNASQAVGTPRRRGRYRAYPTKARMECPDGCERRDPRRPSDLPRRGHCNGGSVCVRSPVDGCLSLPRSGSAVPMANFELTSLATLPEVPWAGQAWPDGLHVGARRCLLRRGALPASDFRGWQPDADTQDEAWESWRSV